VVAKSSLMDGEAGGGPTWRHGVCEIVFTVAEVVRLQNQNSREFCYPVRKVSC
jgi:hypothetical protein